MLRRAAAFLLPLALAQLAACGVVDSRTSAPPNFVVLFADDLGYGDLGVQGHPANRTPHLDRLAAEGQRWTDFYVAAPVCSPSRGALLTGRLPLRTGLYGERIPVLFPNDSAGMPDSEVTLAEALRAEGYATGLFGKWHLGDAAPVLPTRHGFDHWFGLPYSNDMDWEQGPGFPELMRMAQSDSASQAQALRELFAARRSLYFDPRIVYWNVPLMRSAGSGVHSTSEIVQRPADQRVLTRRYTQEAIAYIQAQARAGNSFFLYLAYTMPHTPLFRSERFAGKSPGGRYGDVIEEIDWSVGEIRAALEALGLAGNTLVVFTSDNGPWLAMNQHGGSAGLLRGGKGTTFEGGVRVPAIFWWPGAIAPEVRSDIGSALDLFPTLLGLAGAAPPQAALDGVDMAATLLHGAPGSRNSVPYYRGGELHAWREGPYKIHFITEGAYGAPPARTLHERPLLYHLGEDPAERFDLSARYPEIVKRLAAAAQRHRASFTPAAPLFDRRLREQPPAH